ncbi:MAG TPA: PIN domain-containing protein [Rubrivivax sp.]|nr:PIN domain-containing protein [Rubrivivax sp.]
MRTNFVLIDYENVQPTSLASLNVEHFRVMLFVGANQAKIPFEVASAMQVLGERASYIKIAGNGANALDFHIAFYIGELAAKDPSAYFHVISKDAGFDPLMQHLKTRRISVLRSRSIDDIPLIKVTNTKSLPERVSVVIANLRQRGTSKPRAVGTLSSTVASLFQKQLAESELEELLAELQNRGVVVLNGSKVSYALPEDDA